ncbi:MAG: aldo/keto reductase [Erysipelotrichaceae bacterium]|nr:aldo/keto reductase [Erysipelotrichaceae bacterium]
MKTVRINDKEVSVIACGCMRIASLDEKQTEGYIRTALDEGINFFDHADIYGGGHCEEIFGAFLKKHPEYREKMFLQSKCGIRRGFFDFSYEHIMKSVEGILERLQTDHLDSLLLHRPDVLMETEEVGKAFAELKNSGKVLSFGVSNMNRFQMELLEEGISEKLFADQLQMSIVHTPLIDAGLNVDMGNEAAVMRDAGTLEYLRKEDKILQVWSPLQIGYFEGTFLNSERYEDLNRKLEELAAKYGCNKDALAYAWLLRLPLKVQVVLGTANTEHIRSAAQAAQIVLDRKDWYDLYLSAGNTLP